MSLLCDATRALIRSSVAIALKRQSRTVSFLLSNIINDPFIVLAINYIMSRAFVLLNCDLGSRDTIIDELLTFNGVSYADKTQGVYEIIALLELSTQQELRDTIVKIRRIDAVRSSMTLMVTKERIS